MTWEFHEPAAPAPAAAPVKLPAQRHLLDLLQLGRIGYVRGIEAKLAEIGAAEPDTAAFTAHLETMVRRFELKRYMAYLQTLPGLTDVQ